MTRSQMKMDRGNRFAPPLWPAAIHPSRAS